MGGWAQLELTDALWLTGNFIACVAGGFVGECARERARASGKAARDTHSPHGFSRNSRSRARSPTKPPTTRAGNFKSEFRDKTRQLLVRDIGGNNVGKFFRSRSVRINGFSRYPG